MNSCKQTTTFHLIQVGSQSLPPPLSLCLSIHYRTNQEEMLDSIHDKTSQFEDSSDLSSEIQTTVSEPLPLLHILPM